MFLVYFFFLVNESYFFSFLYFVEECDLCVIFNRYMIVGSFVYMKDRFSTLYFEM